MITDELVIEIYAIFNKIKATVNQFQNTHRIYNKHIWAVTSNYDENKTAQKQTISLYKDINHISFALIFDCTLKKRTHIYAGGWEIVQRGPTLYYLQSYKEYSRVGSIVGHNKHVFINRWVQMLNIRDSLRALYNAMLTELMYIPNVNTFRWIPSEGHAYWSLYPFPKHCIFY